MLNKNGEIKRKWNIDVEWIKDEIERRKYEKSEK
jgi:hypothetical protein